MKLLVTMNVRCAWTTIAPTFFCDVDEDNDDDIILSLRNLPLVERRKTIFDSVAQNGWQWGKWY